MQFSTNSVFFSVRIKINVFLLVAQFFFFSNIHFPKQNIRFIWLLKSDSKRWRRVNATVKRRHRGRPCSLTCRHRRLFTRKVYYKNSPRIANGRLAAAVSPVPWRIQQPGRIDWSWLVPSMPYPSWWNFWHTRRLFLLLSGRTSVRVWVYVYLYIYMATITWTPPKRMTTEGVECGRKIRYVKTAQIELTPRG